MNVPVYATSNQVIVTDDGNYVTFAVPIKSIKLPATKRNLIMTPKQVAQFPNAIFRIPRAEILQPSAGASPNRTAQGTFTLNGRTQQVSMPYTLKITGKTYSLQGTFDFTRSEYKIGTKETAFWADVVSVGWKLQLIDQ